MTYRKRLEDCVVKLNDQIAAYNLHKNSIDHAVKEAEKCFQELQDIDAALVTIQNLAIGLQSNVRSKIVSVVQRALDVTFPDMTFDMQFTQRRDKTECDLICIDGNGNKQDILDGCGGGCADIISMALRIAIWSLDKSAADTIILDEPIKFLSAEQRQSGADFIKVLSEDLGIQFIVVSHIPEVIDAGTTIYRIVKDNNGVSKINS